MGGRHDVAYNLCGDVAALQASEALLHAIYAHAPVGISQTSLTGQLIREEHGYGKGIAPGPKRVVSGAEIFTGAWYRLAPLFQKTRTCVSPLQ
jgi:hypothetical protein